MRNLKKFLALVLTVMMVMGLMVTANAVTIEDLGVTNPNYETAALVTNALGLFHGDGDGFNATRTLTRIEFASLVYRLSTGDLEEKNLSDYDGVYPFSDVTATSWAWGAAAVNYVYQKGYMNGDEGKFDPIRQITGVEVATVLLRLLGYGANGELTGSQWDTWASIYSGNSDANRDSNIADKVGVPNLYTTITREAVAQMFFNTLLADTVIPNGDGSYTKVSGITGSVKYLKSVLREVDDSVDGPGAAAAAAKEEDYFGRPTATKGYLVGEEFIVTQRAAELVYSFPADGDDAAGFLDEAGYDLTSGNDVSSNVKVYVDGLPTAAYETALKSDANLAGTSMKALEIATSVNNNAVEVYAEGGKITHVIIIHSYINVMDEDDVVAAEDDTPAHIKLTRGNDTNGVVKEDFTFDTEAFVEGDVVIWTLGKTKDENGDPDEDIVVTAKKATKVTGTLQKISADGSTYTISGTDYVISDAVTGYDDEMDPPVVVTNFTKPYIFYVGPNNGIVKVVDPEAAEEEPDDGEDEAPQYVYVLNWYAQEYEAGNLGTTGKNAEAKAKIIDLATGTLQTIDLAIVMDGGVAYYANPDGITKGTAVSDETAGDNENDGSAPNVGFYTCVETAKGYVLTPVSGTGIITGNATTVASGAGKVEIATATVPAVLVGSTPTTYYADGNTTVTEIEMAQTTNLITDTRATTKTGYKNFVALDTSSGYLGSLIFTKDNTVSAIYVIKAATGATLSEAPADDPDVVYTAIYTGAGGTDVNGAAFNFIINGEPATCYADPTADGYAAKVPNVLATVGMVVDLKVDEDGKLVEVVAAAARKVAPTDSFAITLVGDDYIIVTDNGTAATKYPASSLKVYQVKDGKVTASTLAEAAKVAAVELYKVGGDNSDAEYIALIVFNG